MERTLYPIDICVKQSSKKGIESPDNTFEHFKEFIEYQINLPEDDRKIDYESEKRILFLKEANYKSNRVYIKLASAKYNKQRNVIDTTTTKSKGVLKGPFDGDEEFTHLLIDFSDDGQITGIIENNKEGVGTSKYFSYINELLRAYHEIKNNKVLYLLKYENILCDGFIEELENMRRINMVTLTVNYEDLNTSDFKQLNLGEIMI